MPILYKDKKKMLFAQWFRCTGCNYCIEICKHHCLETSTMQNSRLVFPPVLKENTICSFCRKCEYICPHQAIYVVKEEKYE